MPVATASTSPGCTALDRTFEAILLDWDGTAVPDRRADATAARRRIEALCAAGVHVFVVSGTHVDNVDGQLRARPAGPGCLFLCLNRGSEVFEVTEGGPGLAVRREATAAEDQALDRAAAAAIEALGARGIEARVVSQRLNRRKIDLIPEPAWADPPKASIDALLDAVLARLRAAGLSGLVEVVQLALAAATASGLTDPRVTSDVKHVEIGLTDKSDSARWVATWLARRGITGGLVLIGGDELGPLGGMPGSDSLMLVPELARAVPASVGVEPEGVPAGVLHLRGGPDCFLGVLDDQLARRAQHRVPTVDADPAWVLPLPDEATAGRVAEALGSLSNGWAGVRGTREEDGPGTVPAFLVAGVYTAEQTPALLPGPWWCDLRVDGPLGDEQRLVDLRTGVLQRAATDAAQLRTLRFLSAADPHVMAMRVEGSVPAPAPDDDERVSSSAGDDDVAVVVASRDWRGQDGERTTIERIAAWATGRLDEGRGRASSRRRAAVTAGFDRLLADHRAAWAERWSNAEVSIEGSPDDQLAARFAVFHLLSAAATDGEAAVGARGLTGDAYGGHVFWDADIFVLPALAAICPTAARAMLEYRLRRLPAARQEATAQGRLGARFPWESAGDGHDVTPVSVTGRDGEPIPVLTGRNEEHIVADVAWAAAEYAAWTGDDALLAGAGGDLLLDTARYWASRIRLDRDGRGHLDGVMGPDEYHEIVDDNAYTNVMARWNLRRAAGLVAQRGGISDEARHWNDLADAIVDGWDAARGVYEQFAGYWELEPLLVADVASPPFAADAVLGAARVAGSQLIKQADVVMLHHLVPDEVAPGSLRACLDFYEPRTAHGSSLSPAIYAALLARSRQPERALALFRVAARLDLDDITGTTARGLHLATMGGVWQALAYGFLGLRARGEVLHIDPCLPDAWDALELRLRFRGRPIAVRAERDVVHLSCAEPVAVRVARQPMTTCPPPGRAFTVGHDR